MIETNSPRRTKVLFLCHDGKLYGAQKSLLLLVQNLSPQRYEIFVSFSRPGPLMDMLQAMPSVTVLTHQRIQSAKHTLRNPLKWLGDIFSLGLNLSRGVSLSQVIRKNHIDIVHTNSLVSLEGALAAKLAGVSHVWHIRELFMEDNPRFHLILGRRLTMALVHHFSSQVICISGYVQRQFSGYSRIKHAKYPVLYNAIEVPETLATRLPRLKNASLQLVYTGRVSDGKRFQDLLEAFCLLKKKYGEAMPYQVEVYGDFICPQFEHYVRQRIEDTGLFPFLKLMGYESDIEKCLAGKELLLMPSSMEAFGRTMLDAMVRGIPVVVPSSGAPLEVVEEGKTGFFYEPNNAQSLADCLEKIYDRRESLCEMQQNCYERVKSLYNVSNQIQQLELIYHKALQESPSESKSDNIQSESALEQACSHS